MNEKTLQQIFEKKEKITKYEIIIRTVNEKIDKLKEEIEVLQLADETIEVPPLEPEIKGAED